MCVRVQVEEKMLSINKLRSSQINAVPLSKLCPGSICLSQRGGSKSNIPKEKVAGRSCNFNKTPFDVGGETW